LTIKFTRCRYSCQLSAFSLRLESELERKQRFFSTRLNLGGKMKHADNCAPTLFRFLIEEESKADVRWLKLEVNNKKVSHTQSIQL
jgi:hypothetical protein